MAVDMTDMAIPAWFVSTYLLFPVTLYYFLILNKIDLLRVSVESFSVIMCFLFGYVGILPLFFKLDPLRVATGVSNPELVVAVFLCSLWSIFTLCVGFVVAQRIYPARKLNGGGRPLTRLELVSVIGLMLFCVLVLLLYLTNFSRVALFTALSGGDSVAADRSAMTNSFGQNYHRYSVIFSELLLLVTAIFFSDFLFKKSFKSLIPLATSLSLISFTSVMSAQKGPLITVLISLYLVTLYITNDGKYLRKSLFVFASIGAVVILALYVVLAGVSDPVSAISRVFSRSLTGQITPAYFYLKYFPAYHDFIFGATFPNPGGLLGFSPYAFTREVMNWLNPDLRAKGVVGSAPTIFWGEMYVNFGFLGVAILPFFVGLWVSFVAGLVRHFAKTPVTIGFSVWLCVHFGTLSSTGFSKFVLDYDLVVVSLSILIALFLVRAIGQWARGMRASANRGAAGSG